MQGRKNKIVCFSTTQEQFDALHRLAPTRDSLSSLLREIIQLYLSKPQPADQPTQQ